MTAPAVGSASSSANPEHSAGRIQWVVEVGRSNSLSAYPEEGLQLSKQPRRGIKLPVIPNKSMESQRRLCSPKSELFCLEYAPPAASFCL